MYTALDKKLLKRIKNITTYEYFEFEREDMGLVEQEYITSIIEDLVESYEQLEEEHTNLKENVEENYKRINWEEDYD